MNKDKFLAQYGSVEHLDKLVDHEVPAIRKMIPKNPAVTSRHLDKLISDTRPNVREAAARSHYVTSRHISRALSDPHDEVRSAALEPHITAVKPEHIARGLDDPD